MDVWPYMPQKGITESLDWLTDVQRCRSAEYRHSLRMKPRQEFQCRYMMTAGQFGQAKVLARDLGADQFFVPLWPWFWRPGAIESGELHILKDTDDPAALTAYGTSIMIWESPTKYEVIAVGINSMTPVYPYITLDEATTQAYTYPVVVPLRVGEFAQEFEASRGSFQVVETSARFRIQSGDDYSQESGALYPGTYGIPPVVTDRPLVSSGVREQFERRFDEVDSGIGLAYRFPTFSKAEQSSQITWTANTRADMRALLYWLHRRKGMWKSFWASSWNADFHITHEIARTDTTIEIDDIGLRTNGVFPFDIVITTTAGVRTVRRVTGATAGSTGHEVIALTAQVGSDLYTWEIASVSVLTLYRFASDRIEISHGVAGTTTVTAPITEVPV
jgi:hypothetical protein